MISNITHASARISLRGTRVVVPRTIAAFHRATDRDDSASISAPGADYRCNSRPPRAQAILTQRRFRFCLVTSAPPDNLARAVLRERFDEFLTLEQGASARTNEAYARDLARLAVWAASKGVRDPDALSAAHLREFVYHLKDLGLAPASIRRGISAIRTWYRFLLAEGVLAKDPSEKLETPKKWRVLPEVMTAVRPGMSRSLAT